jgi:hypothetical protein
VAALPAWSQRFHLPVHQSIAGDNSAPYPALYRKSEKHLRIARKNQVAGVDNNSPGFAKFISTPPGSGDESCFTVT